MFVDSHCHLHLIDYKRLNTSMPTVISDAEKAQVEHMLCVATTLAEVPQILKICESHKNISASVGLHPTEAANEEPTMEQLIQIAQYPRVVAIGETGLDYYRDFNSALQKQRFINHIRASKHLLKPLIVHTRMARKDTIDILQQEAAQDVGGVLHCFTEDWEMAQKAIDLNFYISFSGIVTFKKAIELQEIAKKLPLDRILIETDSPFLAPIPFRGKINVPEYVKYVAQYIAQLRDLPIETIALETTKNFYTLFFKPKL